MNAEQALAKIETHYCRLLSEVFLFRSLYSDRELFSLIGNHLHDLFAAVQRPLIDSVVLGICRMLDPAETCGNDNITLYYLLSVMPGNDAALKARVEALSQRIRPLRQLRNKIIGHSDLQAHVSDRIEYRGASHDEILEVLPIMNEILVGCSMAIQGERVIYHPDSLAEGGPDALKKILRQLPPGDGMGP